MKHAIGNQTKRNSLITDNSDLIKLANSYKSPVTQPKTIETKTTELNSTIHSKDSYWTIENVKHNGQFYNVDLKKELLPKANFKQMIENTIEAKQTNDFYTESLKFHYSLFNHLHKNKDNEQIEQIKDFIKQSMEKNWFNTATQIKHKANSLEAEVAHNFGMLNKEKSNTKIIGEDDYVKNLNESNLYNTLLGEKDNKKINEVFNWVTGKDLYLWRLNTESDNERVMMARLWPSNSDSNLDCNSSPDINSGSLGVRYSIAHGQGSRIK